jgi:squalene synthase HpnC
MIENDISYTGMLLGHYENFPVASFFLPHKFRRPIRTIYAFARAADDVADEGTIPATERLTEIEAFRSQLMLIEKGKSSSANLFNELAGFIGEFKLPFQPFHDLLDAFTQDVTKTRYANFGEVMAYCRKSANPIGRLLLELYGEKDSRALAYSDAICSSLQIINFLQDVSVDFHKGRIYLPQDEMEKYGITEDRIAGKDASGLWQPFMLRQIERARKMLAAGSPLGKRLKGRVGLEMRMIILGGEAILRKLFNNRGDMFIERPVLTKRDWMNMFGRAVLKK